MKLFKILGYFSVLIFTLLLWNKQNLQAQNCFADFTYEATELQVKFTDQSTADNTTIEKWKWSFGNGISVTQQNPTVNYVEAGKYEVCLTITTSDGCENTYCEIISVYKEGENCQALFEIQGLDLAIVCIDQSVSLSGAAITSWLWDFGDGTISNEQNPEHGYNKNGTYNVCLLIDTEDGCSAEYCEKITVGIGGGGDCKAYFEYEQDDNIVNFYDLSWGELPIVLWEWIINGEVVTEEPVFSYNFQEPGNYEVCLNISTESGCFADYCDYVLVEEIGGSCWADFMFSVDIQSLKVDFIDFSDLLDNDTFKSWTWDFGDNTAPSTEQNTSHTYTTEGVYEVCLSIETSLGCSDTECKPVNVTTVECLAQFELVPDGLLVGTINLSVFEGNDVKYNWDFGDGLGFSTTAEPTHLYKEPGTYLVCLTLISGDDCKSESCQEITVTDGGGGDDCKFQYSVNGMTLEIEPIFTIPEITIVFDYGDGNEGVSFTHTYESEGIYEVCMTQTDMFTGETCTYCEVIYIGEIAFCEANFEWIVNDMIVSFIDKSNASGEIMEWFWDFGDGNSSQDQDVVHKYEKPGVYFVCLFIVSDSSCIDEYCEEVLIEEKLECEAQFDYVANELLVDFMDMSQSQSNIVYWEWDFDNGETSNEPNTTVEYQSAGTYNVCLTIKTEKGCKNTFCNLVHVGDGQSPDCTFSYGTDPDDVMTVFFLPLLPDDLGAYKWTFGDGESSNEIDPEHNYKDAGTYTVCLQVTDIQTGASCEACKDIKVGNINPDCTASFDYTTEELVGHFISTSTPENEIDVYIWTIGNIDYIGKQISHDFGAAGVYEVCLLIETKLGCSSTHCENIEVPSGLECTADFTYSINGLAIDVVDNSQGDAPVIEWLWSFGDGNFSEAPNTTYTYDLPGTYNVCLGIGTENGCNDFVCKELTVKDDVGIKDNSLPEGISIYSTLVEEDIIIYNEGLYAPEISLINSLGQIVLSDIRLEQQTTINIPVVNLPKGIYFIQLKDSDGNRWVEKIIVQH